MMTRSLLEREEIIPLLSWLNTFKSKDMLGDPEFKIQPEDIPVLLNDAEIQILIDEYKNNLGKSMGEWMSNCLENEKTEWKTPNGCPDRDGNSKYFTSMPVILNEMMDEHLKLAKSVSDD